MNFELMEALQVIEREKGVSMDTLLDALANALVSAYKRMPDAAEEAVVTIDPDSGEMHVYAQELDEDGNVVREWEDLSFPLHGGGLLMHPRLTELDLKCELLDVWESQRIDKSTTVSVRYSSADISRALSAEWAVVDANGAVIPTELAEHAEQPFGRWGRLRRLQAAAPFPEGARLRLSVRTGTRPL